MTDKPGVRVAAAVAACVLAAAAGVGAVVGAAPVVPPAAGGGFGEIIPGAYVVQLASGEPAAVAADHVGLGAEIRRVFASALRGYTARMTAAEAAAVAADPRVRAVIPDRAYRGSGAAAPTALGTEPTAPPPGQKAQSVPTGVARVKAAASSAKAGDGAGAVDADIAILDTGIDVEHPDLTVAGGVDCVTDGLFGSGSFDDERGHGTHIAGTAAARDNGLGVVGVAPGARLWAVRVLDTSGGGSLGTLVCGIDWVTEHADVIDVANISLTGLDADAGCKDGALHEAICAAVGAGVTFTVAAGNNAADANAFTPASYPEVITTSAIADFDGRPGGLAKPTCPGGRDDEFAEFSNFGPPVDLTAPGLCIRSTWAGGGYAALTGTSQSAAHVAGAAALYLAGRASASPAEVRDALVRAGSKDWIVKSDPDGTPEPILDVSSL
jgi:subtilisin